MARAQESYISAATDSWHESLERSFVQMKEYQAARKKLESRRLAYDTSLAKMQKAKREDFRVEEELRSQQAKYEEAEAEVHRRMFDIKDAEAESINDLTAFLEAQLAYHDRCREALFSLTNEWPARGALGQSQSSKPVPRGRSNTVRSYMSTYSQQEEIPVPEVRPSIKSNRSVSARYGDPPAVDYDEPRAMRPGFGRSTTFHHQSNHPSRDLSPALSERLSRIPSDSLTIQSTRSNLRRVDTAPQQDVFADDAQLASMIRSASPITPISTGSQTPVGRRAPPPPPPSRASKPSIGKPAPPPPPAKRTLIA